MGVDSSKTIILDHDDLSEDTFVLDGDAVIYSFGGNDRLFSGEGNDVLDGGHGNDKIFAGDGDDEVLGRDGDDHLYGGSGADNFIFSGFQGRDTIRDFQIGVDKITMYGVAAEDLTVRSHDRGAWVREEGTRDWILIEGISSEELREILDTVFEFA